MSKSSVKRHSAVTARKSILAGLLTLPALAVSAQTTSETTPFTAGVVMERMQGAERFAFVAGIIEGLAMARFARDGNRPEGMGCIYDWFYKSNQQAVDQIYAAFQRYPTYPPGTAVLVLLRQRCPG